MTEMISPAHAILKRHGVSDPYDFIVSKTDAAELGYSLDPSVRVTGSIQLMKRRTITQKAVSAIFKRLRWF